MAIEWSIGFKYYESSSTNFLSSNLWLLDNSERVRLKLNLYYPSLLVRQKWHTDKRNVEVGNICLKDSNVLRGECEVTKAVKNEKRRGRNITVFANLGRVILDLAIQQGDEHDLQPQRQHQVQGVHRDGQVEVQDEVVRNLEKFGRKLINI